MVTEDIASTSDEAHHHHQPSENEGETEDAQHSEKETGTEKLHVHPIFSLPFFSPFHPTSFFFCRRTFILDLSKNTCFRQDLVCCSFHCSYELTNMIYPATAVKLGAYSSAKEMSYWILVVHFLGTSETSHMKFFNNELDLDF